MTTEIPLSVQPIATSSLRVHPPPTLISSQLKYIYSPAPDGTDSNLLIMFHGLGDTMQPFNTLAKSLNLPQTATLSLQGLSRLPLIEEDAFQWWHSFDEGGELIQHPNPTASISTIKVLIDHLTSTTPGDPAWHPSNLHLFGFAQGGQAAAELSLAFSTSTESSFGSLVTILAPLISFPTSRKKSMTPTLILFRKGDERSVSLSLASYRKGFEKVTEVILARPGGMMLRGREEWQVIMKFWSERLQKRSALEFGKDVFEIRGGIGAVPKS